MKNSEIRKSMAENGRNTDLSIFYENLANAIILQAVSDYRTAIRNLSEEPGNWAEEDKKKELEEFFRSAGFKRLTMVDGEMLIRRLGEEAGP